MSRQFYKNYIEKIASGEIDHYNDAEKQLLAMRKRMTSRKDRKAEEALMKAPTMSDEEYSNFIKNVKSKKDYFKDVNINGVKASMNDPFSTGFAADARSIMGKKTQDDTNTVIKNLTTRYPNFESLKGFEENKANIAAPRNKHILLHELGHVVDNTENRNEINAGQDRVSRRNKGMLAVNAMTPLAAGAAAATLPTGAALPVALGASAVGAIGNGVMARRNGKFIEDREDNANNFVKSYLTDELGNRQSAINNFNASPLASARKTYSANTRNKMLMAGGVTGAMGVAGAMYGMGMRGMNNRR